jgi:hypothetical protein
MHTAPCHQQASIGTAHSCFLNFKAVLRALQSIIVTVMTIEASCPIPL